MRRYINEGTSKPGGVVEGVKEQKKVNRRTSSQTKRVRRDEGKTPNKSPPVRLGKRTREEKGRNALNQVIQKKIGEGLREGQGIE